jgi:predicted amidohydrolase
VPGYRAPDKNVAPPDPVFLERAWSAIRAAAAQANVAVVLGTERIVDGRLRATALVIEPDGTMAGFQGKVQIDPSEERVYTPGTERRVFRTGSLVFGVAIYRRIARPLGVCTVASKRIDNILGPIALRRTACDFFTFPSRFPVISAGRARSARTPRTATSRATTTLARRATGSDYGHSLNWLARRCRHII